MSTPNKVVWSEGMFLRTQHFQQQDRHTEWLVRQGLSAQPLPSFGFTRLELDRTAADAGMIGLAGAEGIFPDGTAFALSGTMGPVPPIPVTSGESGLVRLAIVAERAGAALIDPAHAEPSGARFRGEIAAARDAIRGGAEPADIETAFLSARLLGPDEDKAGYVTLPVARVDGLTAAGEVALTPGHLPPALTIAAVPWYGELLREVLTGLDRIAEAHASMVIGGTGASMENLLILELANAARPRIAHLAEQNDIHPSTLYLELAGLAGRMSTYGASARRMAVLPNYDHADPQTAFSELAETLRSLVITLRHVEPKSRPLHVSRHSENIWTVRIDNPQLVQTGRIVLRIGGDISEDMLRKLFVDQATVGAADEFESLWKSRLPGIPLKPLHSQPREIPYDGDRLCLELDRTSEHYPALSGAPGFVLGVSGQLPREPLVDAYVVNR